MLRYIVRSLYTHALPVSLSFLRGAADSKTRINEITPAGKDPLKGAAAAAATELCLFFSIFFLFCISSCTYPGFLLSFLTHPYFLKPACCDCLLWLISVLPTFFFFSFFPNRFKSPVCNFLVCLLDR